MTERERLIELMDKYFEVGDSDFYICNRVKEAFALGTISLDDFSEIDEENTADIADYLLANGVIVPPCKPGDYIYGICERRKSGVWQKVVVERVVHGIEIGINGLLTARCGISVSVSLSDLGRTVFFTREEAEQALKEVQDNG